MSNTYAWLVQKSPGLVLVFDETLVCRGMAEAWRDRLDAGVAQLVEMQAKDLFDVERHPSFIKQLEAVALSGDPISDMPVGLKLATGLLPCRLDAWCIHSANTTNAHVVVSVSDVSKYRDAIAELTDLQTQYGLILDSAGEGVYGLDAEGRLTFGNTAADSILGWESASIVGQKIHDIHHHTHTDGSNYLQEDCPIYAALTDGEVHRIENEVFWHADGHSVPVEYTSTPILRNGRPDGAVVVFRDVSSRKELERERATAFDEIKQLKEQLEQERDYLRDEINVSSNFGEIIGASQALNRTLAQIEAVAPTSANALVLGESGVGKEMIARAIHYRSDRADNPLVKVNCASIPKDLFESEFFGHVKGAFTGAHRDRVGRMQLAHTGTLFLDEIGEIPLSQQGKLLRALQEHEFERVGDEATVKVDVRVIAATNRNLGDEVRAGRFREDLFYRLSVFPIDVPPLRERVDDIGPLAVHFLDMICTDLCRDSLRITKQQLSTLKAYHWPGNIRELKNVIERAVISSTGRRLRLDRALPAISPDAPIKPPTAALGDSEFLTEAEFRELEKTNTIAALVQAKWQVWGDNGAAVLLGIKPSTLTYRMKQFGISKNGTLA